MKEFFKQLLRAEQREPRDRRRLRQGADQGRSSRSTSARFKRGPDVPKVTRADAADHGRAQGRGEGSRRAAARVHGVDHVAVLQAGRRRRRHRRAASWAAASRAGSTSRSSTTSRSRRTSSAQQQSLMLGSVFQIVATARPGHTADELQAAIDDELDDSCGTSGPDAEGSRARRQHVRDAPAQRPRGDGRIWRRRRHAQPLQPLHRRIRAISARTSRGIARDGGEREDVRRTTSSSQRARVVVFGVPGEPDLGAPVPTPRRVEGRAGHGRRGRQCGRSVARSSSRSRGPNDAGARCRRRSRSRWRTA